MPQSAWQYLKSRDGWDRPAKVRDDQVFLMIEVMESWFLADRAMLRSYFGQGFIERHLKPWPVLEQVPKKAVLEALRLATAGCVRQYSKGKTSFALIAKLDPGKVAMSCPGAQALLQRLSST